MTNPTDLKFLIVDDFSTMRRIIRGLLKEMGCNNAEEAEDGVVALNMLRQGKFEFVVSDINMPNMNGFEVLEAMRGRVFTRAIPVLVLTARHAGDDVRRAISLGAKDYLTKPFNEAQLMARVARLLRRPPSAPPKDNGAVMI